MLGWQTAVLAGVNLDVDDIANTEDTQALSCAAHTVVTVLLLEEMPGSASETCRMRQQSISLVRARCEESSSPNE